MKLRFNVNHTNHPDPFVLDDGGKYYMYPSTAFGDEGIRVYSSTDPINGVWTYEGIAAKFDGASNYWAPSVVKYNGKYYIYVSFERGESHQYMHVAQSDSPLGPSFMPKINTPPITRVNASAREYSLTVCSTHIPPHTLPSRR